MDDANIQTSRIWRTPDQVDFLGNYHAPALDLDFPCTLIESSTPGHHHLILDKRVRWDEYVNMMRSMVQPGYSNLVTSKRLLHVATPR